MTYDKTLCNYIFKTLRFTFSSAPGGDLQKVIDDDNVPFEADVVKFIHHVVEGLAYMHQRKIAHLDIKVSMVTKRVKVFLAFYF